MLTPGRGYSTKPSTPVRSSPGDLCRRCAMSRAYVATWPGGCPLVKDLQDLCPWKNPPKKDPKP